MFKLRFLDLYEGFTYNVIGPFYRNLGKNLAGLGLHIQGSLASDDRLVPSLRRKGIRNQVPNLVNPDFIAPNATILGNVDINEHSSVWYGAVLRGDLQNVKVGKYAILQDLVTVAPQKAKQAQVGDNVLVGPNATLESVTLENNSFVGMGASIRNGSRVESFGVVAAGAVIPENTVVPSYQIWAGNPASYLRDLTNEEKEVLEEHRNELLSLAKVHAEETEKSFRQILDDEDNEAAKELWEPEEFALAKMQELGFPMEYDDEDRIEQRVIYKENEVKHEEKFWTKHYDPYEQDLFHFPDSFQIHGENYKKYEDIKKFFEENPYAQGQTLERKERVEPFDKEPWQKKF